MRRMILVIFLILSLFQGFWHEERDLLLCRVGHEEQAITEYTHTGEALANPRTDRSFASFFAGNRQQLILLETKKRDSLQRPLISWSATAPGQKRRIDESIHPEEWGLTVLRLPRSDG